MMKNEEAHKDRESYEEWESFIFLLLLFSLFKVGYIIHLVKKQKNKD